MSSVGAVTADVDMARVCRVSYAQGSGGRYSGWVYRFIRSKFAASRVSENPRKTLAPPPLGGGCVVSICGRCRHDGVV